MIYISLFIFCLTLGTFFPFASETYLVTLLLSEKHNIILLLFFASLGNILGSIISWIFGYFVNYFIDYLNKYIEEYPASNLKKNMISEISDVCNYVYN